MWLPHDALADQQSFRHKGARSSGRTKWDEVRARTGLAIRIMCDPTIAYESLLDLPH